MSKAIRKDHEALAQAGEITETEAAALLGISRGTLAKRRANGTAPTWRRAHSRLIAYSRAAVEAFKANLAAQPVAA